MAGNIQHSETSEIFKETMAEQAQEHDRKIAKEQQEFAEIALDNLMGGTGPLVGLHYEELDPEGCYYDLGAFDFYVPRAWLFGVLFTDMTLDEEEEWLEEYTSEDSIGVFSQALAEYTLMHIVFWDDKRSEL